MVFKARFPWKLTLEQYSIGYRKALSRKKREIMEKYQDLIDDGFDKDLLKSKLQEHLDLLKISDSDLAILHKQAIVKAVSEGRNIPIRVLDAYPELRK